MELKANELRLGNYVYSKSCNCNFAKGIIEIDFEAFRKIHLFNGLSGLSAVPLTEEILLKCGLKRTLYDSSYELNDFSIFLDKRIRENIYIQCEKRNWNVLNGLRIDYLHQLQNLYFALTNEELTVKL